MTDKPGKIEQAGKLWGDIENRVGDGHPGGRLRNSQETFTEVFAPRFIADVMEMLKEKGQEYAPTDVMSNWKSGAAVTGLPKEQYLMVLATKHWDSLYRWASGKLELGLEGPERRIKDLIVYLLLLAWMDEEKKEYPEPW